MSFVRPPRLRPGDTVAVVAPAGPVRETDLRAGLERLAGRYTLRYDERLYACKGHLAGADGDRLLALQEALSATDVRAVIAGRGGYGTTRILDALDLAALCRRPKTVVGSSDLTALGCRLARAGLVSIQGPMVETLGRAAGSEPFDRLVRLLEDPAPLDDADLPLEVVHDGRAVGPLLGGNLSLLASLVGTATLPELAGAVLFVEEVGERPYRIDRMLTQLVRAGVLDGIAGVLVGDLVGCSPKDDEPPPLEVVAERLSPFDVPILAGFPAGHGGRFLAIPHGAMVELDATRGRIRWLEGAVS